MHNKLITTLALALLSSTAVATEFTNKAITSDGGLTGTSTQTGSLRMRKITATVNPAPADVGQNGSIWVAVYIPAGSCAGASDGLYFQDDKGGWSVFNSNNAAATPARQTGPLASSTAITVIDVTAAGVKPGPYLLRQCKNATFFIGVGKTWDDMVNNKKFFAAGDSNWTSGMVPPTVTKNSAIITLVAYGSDDWEVEQERLVGLMVKYGVSYPSPLNGQMLTKPAEGVAVERSYFYYYGLTDGNDIGMWVNSSSMNQAAGSGLLSCNEGAAGKPVTCTAMTIAPPATAGHKP